MGTTERSPASSYWVNGDEPNMLALMAKEEHGTSDAREDRGQDGPAASVVISNAPIGGFMWSAKWASGLMRAGGPTETRDQAALEVRKHVRLGEETFIRVEGRPSSEVRFLELQKAGETNVSPSEG